jgi:hypothetical protein
VAPKLLLTRCSSTAGTSLEDTALGASVGVGVGGGF